MRESESQFVSHGPCEACGSSDANALFDDGHTFCFSCQAHTKGTDDMEQSSKQKTPKELLTGVNFLAWKKRGLTAKSCKKWGCGVVGNERVFNYRDDNGKLIAQKTRDSDKNMRFLNGSNTLLYGKHLWGQGGKMVVVTEGEIDAISISQIQDHRWPVVSVSSGAPSAARCLQANLEWLSSFETVVLWFDADSPGREAFEASAPLFRPGQVKRAELAGYKDANEALVAGEGKAILTAIWEAKEWRPDGILNARDMWEDIASPDPIPSLHFPWTGLDEALRGVRDTEVVTVCAGTGAGKSTFVREIASHLLAEGKKVGMLMLEETPKETVLDLVGLNLGVNLRYHDTPSQVEGFSEAFRKVCGAGNLILFDHFGSIAMDHIESRIRFMAKAENCDVIFLDHISIMVSGISEGDERRMIDNICTRLKSLSMEIRKPMFVVSHIRRDSMGKGHEEGGRVRMNQLRGSQAIGQLSNVVIALERDQQADKDRNVVDVRVLKGRRLGDTGLVQQLHFNKETGRLTEGPNYDFNQAEEDYQF